MAGRTFCAWSPLGRCLSPAPARCPRLWSCGSSLVAPSRCGCCASFPLCVAEKWQNQQVFLLKLVGSGCSDGWCGRQGSGAAGCRKKCSPGLVPSRLIGHVFLPFFNGAIAYLHGHILWSHSFAPPNLFWAWAETSPPDHLLAQLTQMLCSG